MVLNSIFYTDTAIKNVVIRVLSSVHIGSCVALHVALSYRCVALRCDWDPTSCCSSWIVIFIVIKTSMTRVSFQTP